MTQSVKAIRHPSKPERGRSAARLAAIQALYEIELAGLTLDQVVDDFLQRRWGKGESDDLGLPDHFDGVYFSQLVREGWAQRDHLDNMINATLNGTWKAQRVEGVLRAILRIAAREMEAHLDVPINVVIDEYVSLAADFYDDKEPSLVNAILDRLGPLLRPDETEIGPDE